MPFSASTGNSTVCEGIHIRTYPFVYIRIHLYTYVSICIHMYTYSYLMPQCISLQSDFFAGDPQLSVLVYLDNLYEKPELEKSQFFKTLPKVITNYPKVRTCVCTYVCMSGFLLMYTLYEMTVYSVILLSHKSFHTCTHSMFVYHFTSMYVCGFSVRMHIRMC